MKEQTKLIDKVPRVGRDEIVRMVAKKANFTLGDTKILLESYYEVLREIFLSGRVVNIPFVGVFRLTTTNKIERYDFKEGRRKLMNSKRKLRFTTYQDFTDELTRKAMLDKQDENNDEN